jgi:glycosyltransferase involved in cell wall biosynthesis
MNLFKFIGQKDYYLSVARLADAKRVDRIVEAFKKLPDKRLIVIY